MIKKLLETGDKLFELGHHFVHFIFGIATAAVSVDRFPTKAACHAFLVEKRTLGRTRAFEFTVFEEDQAYRHQYKEQCHESYGNQYSCHNG